jgi:hypothetical protein
MPCGVDGELGGGITSWLICWEKSFCGVTLFRNSAILSIFSIFLVVLVWVSLRGDRSGIGRDTLGEAMKGGIGSTGDRRGGEGGTGAIVT